MNETEGCWFALTVKPQHEKKAAWALRTKGLEEFLPLYRARRRWSDRVKEIELPLFPGYVFCRFSSQDRPPVLTTPGVISIVGFGSDPAAIPAAEIAAIRAMLGSGLPVQPWPFLKVGQFVRILEGPLSGLEGLLIREKDSCRVVLSIELLQRSVAVEVDREWICPITQRAAPNPLVGLSP